MLCQWLGGKIEGSPVSCAILPQNASVRQNAAVGASIPVTCSRTAAAESPLIPLPRRCHVEYAKEGLQAHVAHPLQFIVIAILAERFTAGQRGRHNMMHPKHTAMGYGACCSQGDCHTAYISNSVSCTQLKKKFTAAEHL